MRSLNIKYIPELDQLRGLAALLVLYFHTIAGSAVAGHYLGVTGSTSIPVVDNVVELVIANGFTGVALFFVISGFLFTWGALQTSHFDWKKFYTNRFLRIYPLYTLMLLAVFSLGRRELPFGQLLQSLAGFGNLIPGHGYFDIVLWTISVELQFYMLFPFLISLLKRKGVLFIWGLIAVMIMFRLVARMDNLPINDAVYWTLFGRIDQVLIGMALAWYVHHRGWLRADGMVKVGAHKLMASAKLAAGLVGVSVIMLGLLWLYTKVGWKYGESYLQVVWPTLEALVWAAFGIFYVGLAMLHRSWFFKPIQFIGMISFSLYLLHYPIVKAFEQNPKLLIDIPGHLVTSGVLSATLEILPVSIMASLLTYYVIERPPLDLRKQYTTFALPARFGKDKKPAPTASGSDS
jgi:peptidoglycan/LPS O-acetylase OafA/YrhL